MSKTGPVEVDVRLDTGDLFSALASISFRRFGWIFVPVLLVSILLAILRLSSSSNTVPLAPITMAVPFLCCIVFFVVIPYFSARSSLKSSRILQGSVHYAFSEAGIDVTGQGVSGHNDWSNLYKVVETKRALLFYPSKGIFYVIPKRNFADVANLDSMREIIRSRVIGKIKLRTR